MTSVFDRFADRYDAWFDSESGQRVFRAEVTCLQRLMPRQTADWVEVGVGSGRFARALGVHEGVDPSRALLRMARERGVRAIEGVAEDLAYPDDSLAGILFVVTLCFVEDPQRSMQEFARVLRPSGRLLVGFVPAQGA